jgi:hypothetical protein
MPGDPRETDDGHWRGRALLDHAPERRVLAHAEAVRSSL